MYPRRSAPPRRASRERLERAKPERAWKRGRAKSVLYDPFAMAADGEAWPFSPSIVRNLLSELNSLKAWFLLLTARWREGRRRAGAGLAGRHERGGAAGRVRRRSRSTGARARSRARCRRAGRRARTG